MEIVSDLEIRHLSEGNRRIPADLSIAAASAIEPFEARIVTPQWRAGENQVELYGLNGETCLCVAGRRIIFVGVPSKLDETCTLLGRALAVIAMQRGNPVLHAAVVERQGKAIGIAGRSGAGKSTLTMELVRRDYRVVADDIAVCDIRPDALVIQSLYPVTRLLAVGEPPAGWKAIPAIGKQVSTDVPFCREARPLTRLFVIEVSSSRDTPISTEMLPSDKARVALEAQLYRRGIARGLLGFAGLGRELERAVRVLPVSLVKRPPDCEPAVLADMITAHLEQA